MPDLRNAPPPAAGWSEENLRKEGIHPATVIDVGAGGGTRPLLDAFPDAYHVLIEPQQEMEEHLRDHLRKIRGELHLTAVGDREGEAVLNMHPGRPLIASTLERPEGVPPAPIRRAVPITTLDRLAAEHNWEPPFGLKTDAEGADHLVIMGATHILKQTQFVISELSPMSDLVGGHTFAEFIALMDERGFGLCDILYAPRRRNGTIHYLDVFFRPYDTFHGERP